MNHYDQSRRSTLQGSTHDVELRHERLESNQTEKAARLAGETSRSTLMLSATSRPEMILARLEKYERAARSIRAGAQGLSRSLRGRLQPDAGLRQESQLQSRHPHGAGNYLAQGHEKAELYNLLSQAYEGNGQTVEAYNALRTATQIDPKDENNYLDLATLCVDHANYDLGLEIVSIGIRNLPQSDRLYFQRGTLLAMKGQSAQAVEDFEVSSRLSPKRACPTWPARSCCWNWERRPKRRAAYGRRRRPVPNDYLVQYILGEALNRSGPASASAEETEAIQALEKSVRLNPDFAASRAVLGKLLLRRNEVDRAITELEKALELDPKETSSLYQLALAHRKKGNLERAKELFAKVDRAKTEERDKFMNRTLIRLVREGSK